MNKRFVSGLAALAVVFSGALALPAGTFEGFSLTASAAAVIDSGKCGENVSWTLDSEGTLTISGTGDMADYTANDSRPWDAHKDKIKKVIIADGVTSIGKFAFYDCTFLENISIPEGVTSIGNGAFMNCTSLISVTIPKGVTSISTGAFRNCTSLKSVTLPDSITSINSMAFTDCESLKSITVPASVTSIEKYAFGYYYDSGCQKYSGFKIDGKTGSAAETYAERYGFKFVSLDVEEARGTCGKEVTWTLDSVGTLTISGSGDMADFLSKKTPWYTQAEKIRKVVIADGVTSIGAYAFHDCISLKSIAIPDSVTSIGDFAFSYCKDLESITIPEGVTFIGRGAFDSCISLESLIIPESVTEIDESAFCHCSNLANVTLPNSILSISSGMFADCESLKGITIPNSVKYIGSFAFHGCKNLASVTIPKGVAFFGARAFWNTKWLEAKREEDPLVIINNILIDGFAASGDITVPDSVTGISEMAFYKCANVESINIPNSVASIGNCAFEDCVSLSNINIPKSITTIEYYTFDGCTSLESIIIPDNITSIGQGAFEGCSSLKSVTIPKSVASIAAHAFGYYFEKEYKKYEDFTIEGCKGTAAETYAKENGFEFIDLDGNANKYPVVKAEVKGRQFRLKWTAVPDAEKYGLALYQSGKWRVKVQFAGNVTSYTSPKIALGKYQMVLCAKVNGEWDTRSLSKRAFTVTIA